MQTTNLNIPRLLFLHGKKILVIKPDQIIRLEAKSNYTRIFFTDHPPLLMAKVLGRYDALLSPFGFVRTHRSHLVNRQYVTKLDQHGIIHMTDSSSAEISRRRKAEVCRAFCQL
jgi:two-component system LytT family response regulator